MSTILGANPLEFVTNESSLLDLNSVKISEESTYLSETLKFIQECNKEFDEANRGWYKAILESGNDQEVITESFRDFFIKVKDIIDKFIAYIKSLAERFITNIMSISKSDNYIKKHQADLKRFKDSKDQFDFEGYEFTFNPAVPVCEVQAEFTQEFIELKLSQDETLNAENVSVTMKNIYNELIKKLENGWYDEFRKTVLSTSKDISQSDFANECFSTFRNNSSDKENITVNSTYVDSAYARFTNYSDMKKDAEKIKTRITKEYEAVKKQILDISKTSYTGKTTTTDVNLPGNQMQALTLNGDSMKYLDLYVKAKADQVQEMSNIHAIAFACKLDAMKASFVQDKTILYKALTKAQRVHSEANYTDYTKEFEYASFLMESLENQESMERYIQECCILSEGVDVFERIQALNENKISEKFKKFSEWIKGLVAKFVEKLNAFAAKDTTYLEKYKDIILGKKFNANDKFNMPDYATGLKRIGTTAVPQFNYASQAQLLAGENGEFAKSIIKEYDPSKYDSFSAFCKEYFQGGAEARDYSGSEIGAQIRDMYNFCYDFKKIKDQITKDQNTLLGAARSAEDVLTKASRENEANRNTAANNTGTQQESYVFSNVYITYFTEEETKDPLIKPAEKAQQTTANTQGNSDADKKLSNNVNNITDKDNKVDNNNDEAKKVAADQEVKQITDNVNRYTDVCGSLLTAKLTAIEKIRSDYMKIIRYHVQNYVGKVDDRGDNRGTQATGTDYRNLSDEDKKKVQDAKKQYDSVKGDQTKQSNVVKNIAKATGIPEDDVLKAFDYYLPGNTQGNR